MSGGRPSKVHISATEIQEVNISEGKKSPQKTATPKRTKSDPHAKLKKSLEKAAAIKSEHDKNQPNERKASSTTIPGAKQSSSGPVRRKSTVTPTTKETKSKNASENTPATVSKSRQESSKASKKPSHTKTTAGNANSSPSATASGRRKSLRPGSGSAERSKSNTTSTGLRESTLALATASTFAVPMEVIGIQESQPPNGTSRPRSSSAGTSRTRFRDGRRRTIAAEEDEVGEEERLINISVAETDARKRSYLDESFHIDDETMAKIQKITGQGAAQPKRPKSGSNSSAGSPTNSAGQKGQTPEGFQSKEKIGGNPGKPAETGNGPSGSSESKSLQSDTVASAGDPASTKKKSLAKDGEDRHYDGGTRKQSKKNSKDKEKGGLNVDSHGNITGLFELGLGKEPNRHFEEKWKGSNDKSGDRRGSRKTSGKAANTGKSKHGRAAPHLVTRPSDVVPDPDSGKTAGPEHRRIPEEWFAPADEYRQSIDATKHKLASLPASPLPGSGSELKQDESTETVRYPQAGAAPADGDSSSTTSQYDLDNDPEQRERRHSRRRSSRRRKTSAKEYKNWKRKTSAKAYTDYLRSSDPRYQSSDDEKSHKSGKSMRSAKSGKTRSSASVYPASSSEILPEAETDLNSEISEPEAEPEPESEEEERLPDVPEAPICENCVTVATSTSEMWRTEGTQTGAAEFVLLDRRSCLVKVLAALQRLNTDQALQVARILRRSIQEDPQSRVYEDFDDKEQKLRAGKSLIDASHPPVARTESQKVVAEDRQPPDEGLRDDIPDEDYDEMTRVISQIDLMVKSKLRITAAPYSLIYETLINYHLEICQDYTPSVAVFNYYLTEQGHPLFDDTSGFARPTILQVPRESLVPRLYAHVPYGEPRLLPEKSRLLQLQLFLQEMLICPFCGADVIWGQYQMCAEFCCDEFAHLVASEYEEDLGTIRRQAKLRAKNALLGELDEPAEVILGAIQDASGAQAPAKISCSVDQLARLQSIRAYGQEAKSGQPVPELPGFTMEIEKKPAPAEKGDEDKAAEKAEKAQRRSASGRRRGIRERRKSTVDERRHASAGKKKRRRRKAGTGDDAGGEGELSEEESSAKKRPRSKGSKKSKKGGKKKTIPPEASAQVKHMETVLGRKLSPGEIKEIMGRLAVGLAGPVDDQSANRLSITTTGISERPGDVDSLDLPDLGSRGGSDDSLDQKRGEEGSLVLLQAMDSGSFEADDEWGEGDSASTRHHGKGKRGHRGRRRTHSHSDSGSMLEVGSRRSRAKRDGKRGDDKGDLESVSDDQLHYRLSDSTYLESGVTLLPLETVPEQKAALEEEKAALLPPAELDTHPAERGERQFLQEYYPDGKLFVTWFDDGSGHVLYPCGEPAILVTQESNGRRFVVMSEKPCMPLGSNPSCVLAMFDPRGVGYVYSESGKLRLLFDQWEGWYHREEGGIRRWRWMDLDNHINHSPVLQPIIFAISKYVAVRVIRQDYIVLSFWANQRSARFNVGVTTEPPPEGTELPQLMPYRIAAPPDDERRLLELRMRVRQILTDMTRMTDEPAKYVQQHIGQRDIRYSLSGPPPKWMWAEPRRPPLPGGTSAGLQRRSASAAAVSASARQAFLLQRMLLARKKTEHSISGEERHRRSHSGSVEA